MAHSAIGLDIGSASARAAQVSFGRAGAVLDIIGEVPLPEGAVVDGAVIDGPTVTRALKQLWREGRFAGKKVHLGVANQRVVVREVTLPDMPAKDLALALPYQVQDVLPVPVELAVLDFHPLEHIVADGAPLVRGLLVAAMRDMVMANIDAVQAAGLYVASIDLAPFAVLRAVGSRYGDAAGTEALIDIGSSITSLVVHRDGVPSFVRVLLSGGHDLTEALAERAGLSVDEANAYLVDTGLVDTGLVGAALSDAALTDAALVLDDAVADFVGEIRSTLDYFTSSHGGYLVDRVVLTGIGASLPGLVERMALDLDRAVTLGDPASHVRHDEGAPLPSLAHSPGSAVPVGLALGALL